MYLIPLKNYATGWGIYTFFHCIMTHNISKIQDVAPFRLILLNTAGWQH